MGIGAPNPEGVDTDPFFAVLGPRRYIKRNGQLCILEGDYMRSILDLQSLPFILSTYSLGLGCENAH